MSLPKPPNPQKTFLSALTQAFQTVHAKVDFSKLALKSGARIPELWIEEADKREVYPLLGERYVLGRSSKLCDIVVRNRLVSQIHVSLTRDRQNPRNSFVIRDEKSTNGLYRGKKRLSSKVLKHGDVLTLGPTELADAVTVRYVDPPPWYVRAPRYGLYGVTGFTALAVVWIVGVEWPKIKVRPLPESVQGPVIVYANQNNRAVPLRSPRSQAHIEQPRLSNFSPYLPKAVIASEDSRYHWHLGVDPIGVLRALVTNIRGGEIREGGSTLTQQLARSIYRDYVGTEDSAGRKIREAIVALKLETFYSKNFLLRTYLNRVYLGSDLYGFEDAAQFYFDKSAKEVNLSEAATLAGILPAPNAFNPVQDYQAAVEYRDRVLSRMATLGMVSAEDARRARRSRIEISPEAEEELQSTRAPYFYGYIFDELETVLGAQLAREGSFIVETGLDLDLQALAETSVGDFIRASGTPLGFSQGALVTLDTASGEVLALVGGADYQASQFNRATQAFRQPGSTFKIFTYATALEKGFSLGRTYSCQGLDWRGQFFQGCRSGSQGLNMSTGMARSENVVALRIAQDVGLKDIVATARRLGIRSDLNAVPGLVLGGSEVTPLEITGAFGAIANAGVWNRPHGIKRVLDSSDCAQPSDIQTCRVIYDFSKTGDFNQAVMSANVARVMTGLLQGVVKEGTGRAAFLGRGEAGKTGTTNDSRDLWFIGYIPRNQMVTGVWLGNDDNSPTSGSSVQAAQLWGNYMSQAIP
ncbi:MAG: transglycosylase domain-containing protein [Leptolyngbyaceae cyanobacterium MO_188.B28]|nr:transglycosylase domain-containing protein [Leptolyngbyaceae cyanobacterium MO_188.B28]